MAKALITHDVPSTSTKIGPSVILAPAAGTTIVTTVGTQVLTNKTLTAPTITAPTITGAATVGTGATFTNGTFNTPAISSGTLANATLGVFYQTLAGTGST